MAPDSASFLKERRLRTIKKVKAAIITIAATTAMDIPAIAPLLRPPEELDLATDIVVDSAGAVSEAGIPVSLATPVDELLGVASSNPVDVTLKHGIWRVKAAASTRVCSCIKGLLHQNNLRGTYYISTCKEIFILVTIVRPILHLNCCIWSRSHFTWDRWNTVTLVSGFKFLDNAVDSAEFGLSGWVFE